MAADPIANSGPAPVKPQPGEEFFRQSIADLSRRLTEREGRHSESEAQASAEARRRAMQAYELERARRLRLMLGGAGAIIATACIAGFIVVLGEPEAAPAVPGPVATAEPAAPVVMASAVPTPQPPPPVEAPPPATPVVETQPPAAPVASPPPAPQIAAAPPSEPPPQVATARAAPPAPTVLSRGEIREVQKRLAGFGFNPGPVDGVAGRQTEVATQRYLETRGQPQMPPTEPQLLEQLRQDPAPPVAPPRVVQRASRPDQGTTQGSAPPPARRSIDPFEPVKVAGAQITHWLQSAFR
jgi:hypothetical protein